MNSSGSQIILRAQASAITTETVLVDNNEALVLQVATDGTAPDNQKLYVYGSLGLPDQPGKPINPQIPASPANPYSPLMLRDLNDLDAIVGTDGIVLTANMVKMYEINVSAVRDIHLKLTGGTGTAVTAILRPYHSV